MPDTFRAFMIDRPDGEKTQTTAWHAISQPDLMAGDVTVRVTHTTMNYKDALAITGRGPVVRRFPMIPGIDFAGEVTASDHADFAPGDSVILNGWGVGEVHHGGYAGFARVKGDWLLKTPQGLSPADCMAIGTAGYTAALCVQRLIDLGVGTDRGTVLVSGAAGGVGSLAISLLSTLGYTVAASTGRTDEEAYLKSLGASEIIDRREFSDAKVRPLNKERFAAAVDAVGSTTLANILSMIKYGGVVAACGLAQGADLPATVMPFILRGVTLAGVDSVMAPKAVREAAWRLLDETLDRGALAAITREVEFDDVQSLAEALLDGRIRGRLLIKVA